MSRTLDILERLIGFDTVSARSNLELVAYAQDLLEGAGWAVRRLEDPSMPKAGLHARLGPGDGGIVLSAHADVVPVEGQDWARPAFTLTRDERRLYGRGTTDMKGFLAAMLATAEQAAGRNLRAPLQLVISYDEELGCIGINRMRARLVPLLGRPELCIVGEPTEMRATIGHKGKRAWRARCHGEPGHSALAPLFRNALHDAVDLVAALRAIQADLAQTGPQDAAYGVPYSTVHVGTLHGGTALNIVPDRAELRFELRHLAEDDPDAIEARIRAAAAAIAPDIEITEDFAYPGLAIAPDHPAVGLVQALSGQGGTTKVTYGTEAGIFAEMGIAAVVCGPGSMEQDGHKADEGLDIAQLAACEAMLGRVVEHLA